MLIDWFTVIAQAVNFLILVGLLKRFLYRPILDAIDAREKRIALALADADAKRAEAEKERDAFQHRNAEFDRQRDALWSQATGEAKAERLRLLDAARQASDSLRARQQEALIRERQGLDEALARRTREEVLAIARKVLADLAGATLEERMTDVFLRRLRELDDAALAGLKSAFEASSGPLLVRTAFALSPPHRAAIETALRETLGGKMQVRFETAPDLVSGIEIGSNGHKVAWSVADYLASLGKAVDALLKAQPEAAAKAGENAHGHAA
ncbi:MAG TPA: F0F1 ATP synthase subunit B [Thiobacillus sp.]